MRALSEAGRSVPGDVSVVGFDDQSFAAMWVPSLTTVAQDFDELGRRAFALLETLIRTGRSAQTSSVSPRLVIRESTAPPPEWAHRPARTEMKTLSL
jgi:DNA-binding LacI/PurR family transcriptional regulator